jgi:oxygen-dependent protoporphyrinogen oxidase
MGSRHAWAKSWWSFKDLGVGKLTRTLGARLAADPGCDLYLQTRIVELRWDDRGVAADVIGPKGPRTLEADSAIVAVPGALVAGLMPGLDADRRAFFDRVEYASHHIGYYLVEDLREPVSEFAELPAADGWERVACVSSDPIADDRALVEIESRDGYGAQLAELSDEDALRELYEEMLRVFPALSKGTVADQYLQRNDLAICKRRVGYIRALADFKGLPPLPRVRFAGDYMINSTVGQAHYSGLQAAKGLCG